MYVLLPPSETKEPGGDGPALDLDALGFPALNPLRAQLIERLTGLCADPAAARAALGVAASKDAEIAATAALRTAPTRPALRRYTGVLFDHLDMAGLPPAARARAADQLLLTSTVPRSAPLAGRPAWRSGPPDGCRGRRSPTRRAPAP